MYFSLCITFGYAVNLNDHVEHDVLFCFKYRATNNLNNYTKKYDRNVKPDIVLAENFHILLCIMYSVIYKNIFFVLIIAFCVINRLYAQYPVINEVMPANGSIITDEDGDYSDWIEIYNPTAATINLKGYTLSDDTDEPAKWSFPAVELASHDFMLVFASGKDRRIWANQWETIIDRGDQWKYRPGNSEPPAGWNLAGFNDDSWKSGPSGFGYGDGDDETEIDPVLSIYIRKEFTINNISEISTAILHMVYDDAFVAYINGIEVARANIGVPGVPPAFDQESANSHEASGVPERFLVNDFPSILTSGTNALAIQVHNVSSTSSDMSAIPYLTLGKVLENPTGDHISPDLQLATPRLHTNFKVSNTGEHLLMDTADGGVVSLLNLGKFALDVSYGCYPDGSESFYYFNNPTPGYTNSPEYFLDVASPVNYSLKGGFYQSGVNITLTHTIPSAEIHYTTDGSIPGKQSPVYNGPVSINETTVLRTRAFVENMLPGEVGNQTFFIKESFILPVISLATNPENLWDEDTGIYVEGPNAEPGDPHFGANYWQDWERPVHIEYFEPDGKLGFSMDCGVKIYGAWSRARPQKSMAFYARSKYGYDEIAYPLFKDKDINSFQSFVLRNSGNDWNDTMMRDPLMTGLIRGEDIDVQAYQPAILFMNGEYWGLLNIREKISEHFIAENHPVDPSNLDVLESNIQVIHGDALNYREFIDFLEANNMGKEENYQEVQKFIEVDNFITYQVAQIYFDNKDWPGNNIKYWRPRLPGGKWRWILYDTDFGFCMYESNAYSYNTLAFALDPDGPDWPNPPWSTFVLRKLCENQNFRNRFINRFADYLNSIFLPDVVDATIRQMEEVIEPEMGRHFDRWGGSLNYWHNRINSMINFSEERPEYLRDYIQSQFNLTGTYVLNCTTDPPAGGKIRVNTNIFSGLISRGVYFNSIPVTISAIPSPGYRFTGWDGASSEKKATITMAPAQNVSLTAKFVKDENFRFPVVINEINYNSSQNYNPGDWFELYNNGDTPVDLSGWKFSDADAKNTFIFPAKTVIESGGYLVVCENLKDFEQLFSDVTNVTGNFNFGLANEGEYIQLTDSRDVVIDSLTFDDKAPWPVEADGSGSTLSLRNPIFDNARADNWLASGIPGTPGKRNDIFDGSDESVAHEIPRSYSLYQNYPNPFNPSTTIAFDLPESARIRLEIFDILGRKIDVLFDGMIPAGRHQIVWQPRNTVASGIYFYRLTNFRDYTKSRKMLFIR